MAAMSHAAVPTRLDPAAVEAVGPTAGPVPSAAAGMLAGAAAMVFVGGSVAVSSLLSDAPLFTAQAVRYTVACLLLLGFARVLHRRVVAPRGAEWGWLLGVAVTGLVVFNIALVNGSRHAEPAVLGVAWLASRSSWRSSGRCWSGAARVRWCWSPLWLSPAARCWCRAWAAATGSAWPGPLSSCAARPASPCSPCPSWSGTDPGGCRCTPPGWPRSSSPESASSTRARPQRRGWDLQDLLAVGYLAVAVTAVAFVLWYSSVGRLGAGRAGLLTGVAPVAAAASGVALGAPAPRPLVWVGIAVVAGGLALGLPASRTPGRRGYLPRSTQTTARRA